MLDRIKNIEEAIKNAKTLEARLALEKELIFCLFNTNPNRALKIAKRVFEESQEISDMVLKLSIKLHLANAYFNVNEHKEALKIYLELLDAFRQNENLKSESIVLSNIALIFYQSWLFNQSIYIWKYLLGLKVINTDLYLKKIIKSNLINVYVTNYFFSDFLPEEITDILSYFESEKKTHEDVYGNNLIAMIKYNILKENFDEAILYAKKLQENTELTNNTRHQYVLMASLSSIYLAQKEMDKAMSCAKKAFEISKKYGWNEMNNVFHKHLYDIYKYNNDFEKANFHLEKLVEIEHEIQYVKSTIAGQIISENEEKSSFYLSNLFKNEISQNLFEFKKEIYLENMKGDVLKIYLDSIVSISSEQKQTRIITFDKKGILYKIPFQKVMEMIETKYQNNHMFFYTNLRSEAVNLYWLHRINKSQKSIILSVIGNEYNFILSRSRMDALKEYINS